MSWIFKIIHTSREKQNQPIKSGSYAITNDEANENV
tara:strand:- start:268 stop:375 length:108 start_codon:yes stop_codon:yes gene_type:complete